MTDGGATGQERAFAGHDRREADPGALAQQSQEPVDQRAVRGLVGACGQDVPVVHEQQQGGRSRVGVFAPPVTHRRVPTRGEPLPAVGDLRREARHESLQPRQVVPLDVRTAVRQLGAARQRTAAHGIQVHPARARDARRRPRRCPRGRWCGRCPQLPTKPQCPGVARSSSSGRCRCRAGSSARATGICSSPPGGDSDSAPSCVRQGGEPRTGAGRAATSCAAPRTASTTATRSVATLRHRAGRVGARRGRGLAVPPMGPDPYAAWLGPAGPATGVGGLEPDQRTAAAPGIAPAGNGPVERRRVGCVDDVVRVGPVAHAQGDPQVDVRLDVSGHHARRTLRGQDDVHPQGTTQGGHPDHAVDELWKLLGKGPELVDDDDQSGQG